MSSFSGASTANQGNGSPNGRPKVWPKYPASQLARCLTMPSRLVPVGTEGAADVVLREAVELPEHHLAGLLEIAVERRLGIGVGHGDQSAIAGRSREDGCR